MDDVIEANRPRHLVDWPVVLVDVECSLCPRLGRYRLARLAERYGAAVPLARPLELIAADCTLMRPGEPVLHKRFEETMAAVEFVAQRLGRTKPDAASPLATLLADDVALAKARAATLHAKLDAFRSPP